MIKIFKKYLKDFYQDLEEIVDLDNLRIKQFREKNFNKVTIDLEINLELPQDFINQVLIK